MTNVTSELRHGSHWFLVPIGLLVASTLGVGSLALIAAHDPNFAIEPNYYDKALHWDQTQVQAADNQRLGYRIELAPRIAVEVDGNAILVVHIADASGSAANEAIVHGTAFANAFASEVTPLDFQRIAAGRYQARLSVRHLGLWEFRLVVSQGGDLVTRTLRSDLVRGTR